MASVKFDCKETPKKILELIDMNKHEMSELDYVYMCNFMKSKYTTVNSEKVVEPVRRRFQKDEKVLYNGRDGTMKWCTIVSFNSTTRSYIIKLQNCGTIRDTVAVRLYARLNPHKSLKIMKFYYSVMKLNLTYPVHRKTQIKY